MNLIQQFLHLRALAVTPGGAQTFSRMHGKMGPTSYPAFAKRAKGAYIWTVDGKQYIDLAGANASAPLGFNHPKVVKAVKAQLGIGGTLSLATRLEVEASEAMVNAVPYGTLVRWVRTGSEAVSGAVRCARHVTGRSKVSVFRGSYHGWHPWTTSTNSLDSFESGLDEAFNDHAAVIVEPPRFEPMDLSYIKRLKTLRRLCDESGAMLIFDDVVYGFRFKTGGLQESSRVRPDIACFSKALGNGVPVGCLVGTPECLLDTPVSSTFGGETTGLAAALAVLKIHQDIPVCERLWTTGRRLRSLMSLALSGTKITVSGTPVHFKFEPRDGVDSDTFDKFLERCLENNLLVHRHANNVSLAMESRFVLNKIGKALAKASEGV